jgi:hypothetical protein
MDETERIADIKDELDEVKEILCTHIGLFNTHLENFKQHQNDVHTVHQELLFKINSSSDSTKDLLIAWQTATSTIKFISIVGSIIKWLSGIAIGFGVLYTLLHGNIPSGK